MKIIVPLFAASILGIGMISTAGAQVYGDVPHGAYQDSSTVQTGRSALGNPRFRALSPSRHDNIVNGGANGTSGIFAPVGAL
jgi:hypothetical protein